MEENNSKYEVPGKIVFDNEDDYNDWQSGNAVYNSGLRDSESGTLYKQPDFIADDEEDEEDEEDNNLDSEENGLDATSTLVGAVIGGIVVSLMWAGPKVKKVWKEKVIPLFTKKSEAQLESPHVEETEAADVQIVENMQAMQTSYEKLKENMTNEEAQQEFIDMMLHLSIAARKAKRLKAANIIDGEMLKEIFSEDRLELLSSLLEQNPVLAQTRRDDVKCIVNTLIEYDVLKDEN